MALLGPFCLPCAQISSYAVRLRTLTNQLTSRSVWSVEQQICIRTQDLTAENHSNSGDLHSASLCAVQPKLTSSIVKLRRVKLFPLEDNAFRLAIYIELNTESQVL